MSREPIPTHAFALVLVRRGDAFLLVHERKHGEGWYLPAGRVEPGETFLEAAVRETREESGIDVELTGVLRIQHNPRGAPASTRLRVFFLARAKDATQPPKSTADEHSLEAGWFTLEEAGRLPLRGDEVQEWMRYVLKDPVVAPLSIFSPEVP
jgi:phosphatase NudJ